jgi:hypothetical protein
MVHDGADNENNRFAVADELNRRSATRLFWGRPKTPRFDGLRWLPPTDTVPEGLAPNPCPSLRLTELMAGRGIRSNFQLFGGVTVGGQVLTGIPWLARLAGHLDSAAVWPFETGFVADPLEGGGPRARRVVFAELWPTLFGPPDQRGSVRDEGQVLTALDACAQLDGTGWASWFDPEAVRLLPAHRRREVLSEEGWILGVTAPSPPPA